MTLASARLARALPHFPAPRPDSGLPKPAPSLEERAAARRVSLLKTPAEQPEPMRLATAADVEAARRRGVEEGRQESQQELERRLAEAQAAHRQALEAERERWAAEQGEVLAASIRAEYASLEARLAEALEEVLRPVLAQATARQAVESFIATLRGMVAEPEAGAMEVFGPVDLLEAVRHALGPDGAAVRFTPHQAPELRALQGSTMIETQLLRWMRLIRPAIVGGAA